MTMTAKAKRNTKARKARSARNTIGADNTMANLAEFVQYSPMSADLSHMCLDQILRYADAVKLPQSKIEFAAQFFGKHETVFTMPNISNDTRYFIVQKYEHKQTGVVTAMVGVCQRGVIYIAEIEEQVFDELLELPMNVVETSIAHMACNAGQL